MAMKKVVLFLMLLASISVNAQTTKPTSNVKGTKYEQKVDSLLSQINTYNRENEMYNFSKRNVQKPHFFCAKQTI